MKRKTIRYIVFWYIIWFFVLTIGLIDICRGYTEVVDICFLIFSIIAIITPIIIFFIKRHKAKVAKLQAEEEMREKLRAERERKEQELLKVKEQGQLKAEEQKKQEQLNFEEWKEQERLRAEERLKLEQERLKAEEERKKLRLKIRYENVFAALLEHFPDDELIDEYTEILTQDQPLRKNIAALRHDYPVSAPKILKALKNEYLLDFISDSIAAWSPIAYSGAYKPHAFCKPATQDDNETATSDDDDGDITIEKIDKMIGSEFEHYLATLFKKKGYDAEITPLSGDYGIDLIITNDLIRIGVQAKRYSDKVSLGAVQEAIGGMKHYNLDKAMVVTSNYFQPSAVTLAEENGVILWNRDKLEAEIKGCK